MDFISTLTSSQKPLILDGAMGSLLMQRLPLFKGCFELLNLEQPDVIEDVHKLYVNAGVHILETNTFGGSVSKLSEYHLADRALEINEAAARVAKRAAGEKCFVGGSVGPIGKMIEPMGETSFDEIYDAYIPQMIGLEKGGADLIIIETMSDVQEARIALLAAKASTKLPVLVSMTFEANGKSVSGTDMCTGFATLAAAGADIIGANCSIGPEGLADVFKMYIGDIRRLGVPLAVWSNAGLPKLVDGRTVFPLSPEQFAENSKAFIEMGIDIIGGCCGTTPEHIQALANKTHTAPFTKRTSAKKHVFATSRFSSFDMEQDGSFAVIGERLNPSARKQFALELKEGKKNFLREEAKKQEAEHADLLDINVGVPAIDEIRAMKECVAVLSNCVKVPLMIDTDNAEVAEAALKLYPGTALLNSINGKEKSLSSLIPIVKRYGCFVVALCLDDSGIHRDAEKRIAAGEAIIARLNAAGISSERILVDPLMLAESAEPGSAVETLKVIEHFSSRNIKTSVGLSNVSFGMPSRKFINNAFLRMARQKGLTAGIVNSAAISLHAEPDENYTYAENFLVGRDKNGSAYIARFKETEQTPVSAASVPSDPLSIIESLVVDGNSDAIADAVRFALASTAAESIMNNALIKGLEKVGDLYSKGEYFLPQMIASAGAMKKGFDELKPILSQTAAAKVGTVVICTVYGDIHDIGKNIVAMMFENHGFTVYDLGKDVPCEEVVCAAEKYDADLVCLSSLLTTTMGGMQTVCEHIKAKGLKTKVMVGGAVVTEEYARSIGAHYSNDAADAVRVAKMIIGNMKN